MSVTVISNNIAITVSITDDPLAKIKVIPDFEYVVFNSVYLRIDSIPFIYNVSVCSYQDNVPDHILNTDGTYSDREMHYFKNNLEKSIQQFYNKPDDNENTRILYTPKLTFTFTPLNVRKLKKDKYHCVEYDDGMKTFSRYDYIDVRSLGLDVMFVVVNTTTSKDVRSMLFLDRVKRSDRLLLKGKGG